MKTHVTIICLVSFLISCSYDNVVAPATGSISGIIKDGRNRKPLANVVVRLDSQNDSVITDPTGMYEMSDVASGTYAVRALLRESGYICYAAVPVRIDGGKTTTADMMLMPGSSEDKGAIIGRVIDENGKAVKGARVATDQKTAIETTSDDGSFVMIDVPGDTVTIDVVGLDRYARKRLFIKVGDTTSVTITALPQDPTKGWLYGSVTSKGEPVPGAIVRVEGLNLVDTTDDLGTYCINNLPEGPAFVSYSRDGFLTRNFMVTSRVEVGLVKDVSLSEQSAVPVENLEFYLPFDGSIEDRSPLHRETELNGLGYSFTQDRFNRTDEAIQFDGTTCVIAVEGVNMNYKPLTIGMWFYVEDYNTNLMFMLGKASYLNVDGYYITMQNRDMSFVYVTNNGKDISSKPFNGGFFEKNRWRWFGFSVAEDGTGYVTMNAQSTYSISPVKGVSTNREPFTVGDVPAAAGSSGFVGKLDQIVVYNRFMKLEDLTKIMETKE